MCALAPVPNARAAEDAGSARCSGKLALPADAYDGLLVQTAPGATDAELDDAAENAGCSEGEKIAGTSYALVAPGEDADLSATLAALESSDAVVSAQPNYRYRLLDDGTGEDTVGDDAGTDAGTGSGEGTVSDAVSVDDPDASRQWGLESIDAYGAWALAKAERSVTVAVVDSGCDVTHEDLAANVVATRNAVAQVAGETDEALLTDVTDEFSNSHGTHVCGIIAAEANNGVGGAGASYNAGILPIKIFEGNEASTATIVAAYEYVLQQARAYNIRVVNMSLGAEWGELEENDEALLAEIAKAHDTGIVTVAAAGNAGISETGVPYSEYPGDDENVVSVMALRKSSASADGVARLSSSNYNLEGESSKNICAPGSSIYSTSKGNAYSTLSGTSMAAPFVSGVLALEFAANGALTAEEATEVLYEGARDLGEEGFDEATGYGEVDARAAVQAVLESADAGGSGGSGEPESPEDLGESDDPEESPGPEDPIDPDAAGVSDIASPASAGDALIEVQISNKIGASAAASSTLRAAQSKKVTINVKKVTGKVVKRALAKRPAATTVVLGKKVRTIAKRAFRGTKVKTLVIKSKKLTAARVRKSLSGSKVKKARVKVSAKLRVNRNYRKRYRSIFKRANSGRKISVVLS